MEKFEKKIISYFWKDLTIFMIFSGICNFILSYFYPVPDISNADVKFAIVLLVLIINTLGLMLDIHCINCALKLLNPKLIKIYNTHVLRIIENEDKIIIFAKGDKESKIKISLPKEKGYKYKFGDSIVVYERYFFQPYIYDEINKYTGEKFSKIDY